MPHTLATLRARCHVTVSGCWTWPKGPLDRIWYEGRNQAPARVAWLLAHPGEYPTAVLRTCRNPACINPAHGGPRADVCSSGHPRTPENTTTQGGCRACLRLACQTWRNHKKRTDAAWVEAERARLKARRKRAVVSMQESTPGAGAVNG
jgi:hypothetical protein